MKSNSSVPEQESSGSDIAYTLNKRVLFGMIPLDDLDWVANQKPAVFRLFVDCWRSDPYGSRWMQLTTRLKSTVFKEAKKVLTEKSLFIFKPEPSVLDGRQTVCWMVRNLHGSRVKEFWKLEVGNPTASKTPVSNLTFEAGNPTSKVSNPTLKAGNPTSILPQTLTQSDAQTRSESFQDLKSSRSSSTSPLAEPGEEELKNLKKTEEKEATQVNASGTDGMSEPESLASLQDLPEQIDKTNDLGLDQTSAAAPLKITKQPNSDTIIEDAALLKWLVEVKIPKMELDDPPRNLLAYAKAMIRRDGDILREEFAEVVREHQFKEECDALTEKVEARVGEWRQAGMKVNLYFDSHGKPQALIDGATFVADEFLAMPVGEKPTVLSISTLSGTDNAQNRTQRLSRLKMASTVGECPNFEFLVECYQDVLLRAQVKVLISRYPEWGIIVDSVGQLQVDF